MESRKSDGRVIASALNYSDRWSETARGGWAGVTRTCVDCEREVLAVLEDGRCWSCNHPGEPAITQQQQKQAVEELMELTVDYLHRKTAETQVKANQATTETERGFQTRLAEAYREEELRLERDLDARRLQRGAA